MKRARDTVYLAFVCTVVVVVEGYVETEKLHDLVVVRPHVVPRNKTIFYHQHTKYDLAKMQHRQKYFHFLLQIPIAKHNSSTSAADGQHSHSRIS